MKKILTFRSNLLLFSIALLLSFTLPAQNQLSAEDWRADLRFLQNTIHQDYPFLFKKVSKEDFDQEVEKLYQAIPNLQEHEVVAGLVRLVSSFKYGHTMIRPTKFNQLPLNFYHFSDGVFVEGVHQDYKNCLGAKVLKVEGMPIEKALEAIYPVVPAENDQYFKGYGLNYLRIAEILHAQGVTKSLQDKITLTLEKDGKSFEQSFTTVPAQRFPQAYGFTQAQNDWLPLREQDKTPYYLKHLDKNYYYEYLPDTKTVYVRYSQVVPDDTEDIPTFFGGVFDFIEQNEVDKLVLDVRLNGGGNNYNNKVVVTGIIKSKINEPGKFFVIIGRRTFSACQNLVNEFDNYTNAIFVGEPTGENINFYGDNRQVKLPKSQLTAYLSWAWWQDKPQWENADWTTPHLAAEISAEDFRTNRDPVLDIALNFTGENFILDPMEYLTNLFQTQQMELLESEARRMVKDPMYKFFNFEGEINRAGYNLLGGNRIKEAIYVFQLNTQLFPESANCYDSLAESYWRANDLEKARELYKKAIKMDPDGPTGENARIMLEKIK